VCKVYHPASTSFLARRRVLFDDKTSKTGLDRIRGQGPTSPTPPAASEARRSTRFCVGGRFASLPFDPLVRFNSQSKSHFDVHSLVVHAGRLQLKSVKVKIKRPARPMQPPPPNFATSTPPDPLFFSLPPPLSERSDSGSGGSDEWANGEEPNLNSPFG
jgi:hypothetical protein